MTTALTDLDDLQAWTTYLQGLAAYTGDPTFINNFNWTSIQTMTVGQYLSLLDQVETFLSTYNWSALAAYLPVLEAQLLQQGLPQSVIDEAIGVLEEFALAAPG